VAFIHRSDILRAVSCSEDHKANVFSFNPEDKSITLDYTVNDHTDGVTGFAIHPIQTLLAVASRDSSITIHDIALVKLKLKLY
jgi:WD40 repeat protein